MPTTPPGAKKPQDRKSNAAKALEASIDEDELLADMPELRAPNRLRLRDRNKVMFWSIELKKLLGLDDDDEVEKIDLDLDSPLLPPLMDLLAQVDEFAESIAVDPDEYEKWAVTKSYDTFSALLTRYASAVGESSAS